MTPILLAKRLVAIPLMIVFGAMLVVLATTLFILCYHEDINEETMEP